jgi:tetratricopeptide (TPR) repeat protein
MRRVTMFAAAALLIAIAVRPAAADDRNVCGSGIGTPDELIAACSSVLARNPTVVGAYSNRGENYRRKGDYDRAIPDFDQALKLDPSLAKAREGIERLQRLLAKRSNPGAQTNAPAR